MAYLLPRGNKRAMAFCQPASTLGSRWPWLIRGVFSGRFLRGRFGSPPRWLRREASLCSGGFDAVTMKRIAGELGAGTMTLYYYVRNKADIVALMQDAIFEDVLVPAGELPSGWRDAVALIARRTRDVLVGHPWAVSSLNQAQFGPNASRHYEQSLAALASTTLSYPQKTEVTAILDDHWRRDRPRGTPGQAVRDRPGRPAGRHRTALRNLLAPAAAVPCHRRP